MSNGVVPWVTGGVVPWVAGGVGRGELVLAHSSDMYMLWNESSNLYYCLQRLIIYVFGKRFARFCMPVQ